MMKKFLSVSDVPNVSKWIDDALIMKNNPFDYQHIGKNKTIGLVFFNPSLRTRLSSQKAAYNLGANCWVLNIGNDSWTLEMNDGAVMTDSQEHIKEAFQVMSTYCDVLGVRTFPSLMDKAKDYSEYILNKVLENTSVPIVSLESATLHPLQSFADMITITENRKSPDEKIKVVMSWAPHVKALPHCVPNSFAQWMPHLANCEFIITHPLGYALDGQFTKGATYIPDQQEAFKNADFIYAKNWSMLEPYGKIDTNYSDWIITPQKMKLTNQAKFMHCLPVRRNIVVQDAVLDSALSIVVAQAHNRIFSAQKVFYELLQ